MKPRNINKELKVNWSKREKDLMIHYPKSCDGHLMHCFLSRPIYWLLYSEPNTESGESLVTKVPGHGNLISARSIKDELEARGYDLSTLKISIKKKK